MDTEKFLGTIIISDENNKDIFRVHIFDESIRFDSRFAYGVSKNSTLYKEIKDINDMWKGRRITKDHIFPLIIGAVEEHSEYLTDFYFTEEELNENGKLKHLQLLSPKYDKMYSYYMHLKNNKKLSKISKREFEKHIKTPEVTDFYIDNYMKKGARFYKYTMVDQYKQEERPCYFMIVNDKIKIGFISDKE